MTALNLWIEKVQPSLFWSVIKSFVLLGSQSVSRKKLTTNLPSLIHWATYYSMTSLWQNPVQCSHFICKQSSVLTFTIQTSQRPVQKGVSCCFHWIKDTTSYTTKKEQCCCFRLYDAINSNIHSIFRVVKTWKTMATVDLMKYGTPIAANMLSTYYVHQALSEHFSWLTHLIFTSTQWVGTMSTPITSQRGAVTCLNHPLSGWPGNHTQLVQLQCLQLSSLHHSASILLITTLDRWLPPLGAKMYQSGFPSGKWDPRKDWIWTQNPQLIGRRPLSRASRALGSDQSLPHLGKLNSKCSQGHVTSQCTPKDAPSWMVEKE